MDVSGDAGVVFAGVLAVDSGRGAIDVDQRPRIIFTVGVVDADVACGLVVILGSGLDINPGPLIVTEAAPVDRAVLAAGVRVDTVAV